MRKQTKAALEETIQHLEVYQQVAWLLLAGEKPQTIAAGPWAVWVLGLRSSTGPFISVTEVEDDQRQALIWTRPGQLQPHGDIYLEWALREVGKLQAEAMGWTKGEEV